MSPLTKPIGVWHLIAKLGKHTAIIVTILFLFFAFAYTTDRKGDFIWPQEFDTTGIFEQLAK